MIFTTLDTKIYLRWEINEWKSTQLAKSVIGIQSVNAWKYNICKIANIESKQVFTIAHTHTTKMHSNLKINLWLSSWTFHKSFWHDASVSKQIKTLKLYAEMDVPKTKENPTKLKHVR